MHIIVVDDERFILNGEVDLICRTVPDAQVLGFTVGADALDYVYANPVDVAILDINMPDYDGIDLARRMKIYRPAINIIFATAYSDYYQQAMRIHASGYMLKPIRAEVLLEELNDLRHPVQRGDDLLHVRTFGDFEVFYHDLPLIFRYQKTKEMLDALKKGDRICTIGGIYGTIMSIKDDTITLAIGSERTEMVVARWAIRSVEDVSVENEGELLN